MLPGHSPLDEELPWITFRAIDWLSSYLTPDMTVFEYGAGGSTLYLAQRVQSVVSVEHDEGFHQYVTNHIAKNGIRNCELMLRKPVPNLDGNTEFVSHQSKYQDLCFGSYVKAIDPFPEGCFDLVMVDGRARMACIKRAISKIKPGGALVLDNSNRPSYVAAAKLLSGMPSADFAGLVPCTLEASQTTVWRMPQ